MDQWLGPLRQPARRASQWADTIRDVVTHLLGQARVSKRSSLAAGLAALAGALESLEQLPESLQPTLTSQQALRIVLDQLGRQRIPAEPAPQAVQLLGWLELAWDDAPAIIIHSLNEGIVPSTQNADLFLPDRLRRVLGAGRQPPPVCPRRLLTLADGSFAPPPAAGCAPLGCGREPTVTQSFVDGGTRA